MRTDVTLDRKQVKLPNACTLGYGQATARAGDWIVWLDSTGERYYGRVIGRVVYAPLVADDRDPIRGWLCVAALSQDGMHTAERWVDPALVTDCYHVVPDVAAFYAWFLSDGFASQSVDTLRRALDYGCVKPNLAADQPQWNFAERWRAFVSGYLARVRQAIAAGRV